ncbi:WD40-repeat-containing domain protein [Neurospora crassa]|nr:WD40-repeat-containing domain protein [Neurospora crassa]
MGNDNSNRGSRAFVPGPTGTMTFHTPFPLLQEAQRQYHVCGSPYESPHSSSDSGYGSAPPTPITPHKKRTLIEADYLWRLGDRNLSDQENLSESDDKNTSDEEYKLEAYNDTERRPGAPGTEAVDIECPVDESPRKRHKPATLPRSSARSHPPLLSFFTSDSASKIPRGFKTSLSRGGNSSTRIPDRFIPSRTLSSNTVERFRTSKSPHQLTTPEKLLRHNSATEDAFSSHRRVVATNTFDIGPRSRSNRAASRNRGSVLGPVNTNASYRQDRLFSLGSIWAVGGLVPPAETAVNNGRGHLMRSGTNARFFRTSFPTIKPRAEEELEKHEARLATALGIDRAARVLDVHIIPHQTESKEKRSNKSHTQWNGTEWVKEGSSPKQQKKKQENRSLPTAPFKVLDAPNLRDDFYCSILSYSATCRTLAVGLGDLLYGWSESRGVRLLNAGTQDDCHLTSVAFSSADGHKAILAYGRSNKTLGLMSLLDDADPATSRAAPIPRFEVLHPSPIACLSWKPSCTMRPSGCPSTPGVLVATEDLLVGDEAGRVWYYSVEWPDRWEVERHNWQGQLTLLARIDVHSQQICGLSWSPNGDRFATGGNDNLCCLFETQKVLDMNYARRNMGRVRHTEISQHSHTQGDSESLSATEIATEIRTTPRPASVIPVLKPGDERYRWLHRAAVKAIAFCPWQEGLVATGGGSNDKCIHFFHTTSGAALATISVAAQVTSLIWSTTRREIAATFGYAQPEHSVRIAVFSWPDCRQVAAVPWAGEHRALYAIPYPSGPNDARKSGNSGGRARGSNRTAMEGCIMVASSDKSVKFHEVWTADKKATTGGVGMLGGSDILESLEGIDREGDVIR